MAEHRTQLDKSVADPLLTKLGESRQALLAAQRNLRRGCVQARALEAVIVDIDDLARTLTGDPTYFHMPPPAGNTAYRGGRG